MQNQFINLDKQVKATVTIFSKPANVIESFTFAALATNGKLYVFSVNEMTKMDVVNKSTPFHNSYSTSSCNHH